MPPNLPEEGELTAHRIYQLSLKPIAGNFDAAHLREIHRYIFQDLPHHAPGQFRPDAEFHTKARALADPTLPRYYVSYAPRRDIEAGLDRVLGDLAGGAALRGLDHAGFSARMGQLYADLDYIHPFVEGNSRTLRTFTSQLGSTIGYDIDWGGATGAPANRDRLYMARDQAVLERRYSGLDEARAMQTNDRAEYEAFFIKQRLAKADPLEKLILQWSTPIERTIDLTRAAIQSLAALTTASPERTDLRRQLAALADKMTPAERGELTKDEERVLSKAVQHFRGIER